MDGYRPRMSPERVDLLRQWHDDASDQLHALGAHSVTYLGLDLQIPEQVFPPTPTSDLLGGEVRARVAAGHRVLDMGSGAGANAILAAQTAREVVAVDVNPIAVETTAANAARNGVGDRVDARVSDVFEHVDATSISS